MHAWHSPVTSPMLFEEHDHGRMDLGEQDDAHARAHAADIRKRFAGRTVTTQQIILFGLTSGLIPCPAAITIVAGAADLFPSRFSEKFGSGPAP
jgi:ABC-type nickel/cobalt efflux system permease component RcnA